MKFGKTIEVMSSGMMRLKYKDSWWRETKDETVKEQSYRLLMTLIIILKSLGFCPEGLGLLTLSANSKR